MEGGREEERERGGENETLQVILNLINSPHKSL